MKGKKLDTTSGSISKNIWQLAWPIMVASMIQVIYNLTDTFWVSRLEHSTEAIAAVTITFSVVFVLVSLAFGLATATATLSSQYFGAKEYDMVKKVAGTSMVMMGSFSILISVLGIMFNRQLLNLLNTPSNVMPYAIEYFNIIMSGMFFMFSFFLLSAVFRGIGDTYTPMIISVISGIINVILDPLLIFGIGPFPELGIAGAAYATVLSKGFLSVYLVYMVFSGRMHFKLSIRDFKVNFDIMKHIVRIGVPAGGTHVAISLGGTALVGRVNAFGDAAAAAFGLGHRLDSLAFIPGMAINQAVATMVGQNLGADNRDRAWKSGVFSLKMTFILMTIIGVLLFIFPRLFLEIFSQDEEVIKLGTYYIRFVAVSYGFIGCRFVMNGIFEGAGAAVLSLTLTIVSLWFIRIPLAYALSYTRLGVNGVWLGIGLSFVLNALFMFYWFNKRTWMEKAVVRKKNQNNLIV